MLILFKRAGHAKFDVRQVRIVELLGRRIAYVVQSAYDRRPVCSPARRSSSGCWRSWPPRAPKHSIASCMPMSIDCTWSTNHGMYVGDEVIVTIAEAMRVNLGANVSASRISGDRFALFFLDTHSDGALPMVEGVRDAIRNADFDHDGKRVPLSISFGLAAVRSRPRPVEQVLQDLLRGSAGGVRSSPNRLVS